jgi:hypothetical protein
MRWPDLRAHAARIERTATPGSQPMNRNTLGRVRLALSCAALALTAHAMADTTGGAPLPPHLATPDAALLPDYVALALTHTSLTDDPAWRPLRLTLAPARPQPAVIVLPVQTQAYGFSQAFNALVGARLDQELGRRHVDASRQTEIVDWRGPFVRRTDEKEVAAFATAHPNASLLRVYVGHDYESHAFITLSRNDDGKARLAHRRIVMPDGEITTLTAITATLPGLLAEIGMGDAKPAAALPAGRGAGCEKSDWALADVATSAPPVATACHALLMGTLLPDYLASMNFAAPATAPARLAWLARAWIEADALAQASPAMRSARTLAAWQLRLDGSQDNASKLVNERDVVVRPLAGMLSTLQRAESAPKLSRNETAAGFVKTAIDGLPRFAAAVVKERALYAQDFRRVELCPMELAVASFKAPAGCGEDATPVTRPQSPPTPGQSQLLDEWRLAQAWNGLFVEGYMRAHAPSLQRVIDALPPLVATHPFIRQVRFHVHGAESRVDDPAAHLARSRARILDYAQVVATLQRDDPLERETKVVDDTVTQQERLDAAILKAEDDVRRLTRAQGDPPGWPFLWKTPRGPVIAATFLSDGPFWKAEAARREIANPHVATSTPQPSQPAVSAALAATAASRGEPGFGNPHNDTKPTFETNTWPSMPTRKELEQRLVRAPWDMEARSMLALLTLESGAGVAQARRVIDARKAHPHSEDDLGESNDLALAGHVFYFAGELEAARDYYGRAAAFDTGGDADFLAKVRLAAMAGHPGAALAWSHKRRLRYDHEWAVADEAGYLFMLKRPDEAWALLMPRLQVSKESAMWGAALAGHRIAGHRLDEMPDWFKQNRLEQVKDDLQKMGQVWLTNYAILDRLPTLADTKLLYDWRWNWAGGPLVVKTALDGTAVAKPYKLDDDIQFTDMHDKVLLMPLYAWTLWNTTGGKDPALDGFRKASIDAGFQSVLTKAMVLAADGKRAEALKFLTVARYELGRRGTAYPLKEDFHAPAYHFVLASWLMSRQTHDPAYAQQGLAIAVAYQHVVDYMAWPYAAEALLSRDPEARAIAACRAQALDAASMMLHESGLHPDPASPTCRKATAWQ